MIKECTSTNGGKANLPQHVGKKRTCLSITLSASVVASNKGNKGYDPCLTIENTEAYLMNQATLVNRASGPTIRNLGGGAHCSAYQLTDLSMFRNQHEQP